MKTFVEFINECYYILEKRGEPSYNYEVALERLYNHLIKGDNRANITGKRMRLAIGKGDIDTVTDIIAQELNKAQNDPKHPLHFDNAPDEGFTGGKKTEDHKQSYYDNLKDQSFTVLNDVQSRTGRSIGARGSVAKRQGEDKVELSPVAQRLYDKIQDTSKPDMVFQDPVRPERVSKTSLKKASGAVAASSGDRETYGNIGIAVDSAIKKLLKSGKISKSEVDELRFSGMSIAGKIRSVIKGSKGQDQKELLPQVDKLQGELESILPGISKEIGIEQLTGKGKYGKSGGVDRLIATGRGGGTIEDPRAVSVTQRARQGKGTTKTKAGPVQRPMAVTADIGKPTTGQQSSFSAFSKKAQQEAQAEAEAQHSQTTAELEQQANQANANVSAAQAEVDKANDPSELRYVDGTEPLIQNRKRFQDFIGRHSTDPTVQHIVQARTMAQDNLTSAQSVANDATTSYQTHINTPPTVQPTQPEQPQQPAQTPPQQPVQQQPAPEQPPAPQPAPEQPPAPQQKKKKEEKKPPVEPPVEIAPEQGQ